jgi:hypothetical protein
MRQGIAWKRYRPEEIIAKLREADVVIAAGRRTSGSLLAS